MSGHSKWSKIKRQKAGADAEKSKVFSKFARMITVESKKTKGDTSSPPLRSAIERAKSANMPNQSIEKAIKRGVESGSDALEEVTYEAYGPGGVAIIIVAITDNKNRTVSEIKHILSKNNTSLASTGAATWAFEKADDGWRAKEPLTISEQDATSLDKLTDEMEDHDDVQGVYTNTISN